MFEEKNGFLVVTPLERGDGASTILVNRGWIAREKESQESRRDTGGLPAGEVVVGGLLREPPQKNMFTPDSKPEDGRFYFMDIAEMAKLTGSQPVYMEETFGKETQAELISVITMLMLFFQTSTCLRRMTGKQRASRLVGPPNSP